MKIAKNLMLAVAAVVGVLSMGDKAQAQWGYDDPNTFSQPVYQSPVRGRTFTDWRSGYSFSRTRGTTVYDTANNPYRNSAIPGSGNYVNTWEQDANGNMVNVRGYQWTAVNGVRHGNLTRTQQTPYGQHTERVYHNRAD